MSITPAQIAAAVAIQHAAAQDNTDQVRLVAGPGTGKSASIEERVRWLIAQGVDPEAICAISFTRASALDLRLHIHGYATEPGYETIDQVPVTTLHSLALRVLRAAGQLEAYPADPLVLDDWELENIFDAEFGHVHGAGTVRRRQIRREHENLVHQQLVIPQPHEEISRRPDIATLWRASRAAAVAFGRRRPVDLPPALHSSRLSSWLTFSCKGVARGQGRSGTFRFSCWR